MAHPWGSCITCIVGRMLLMSLSLLSYAVTASTAGLAAELIDPPDADSSGATVELEQGADLAKLRAVWRGRATAAKSARYVLTGTAEHMAGSMVRPDDSMFRPDDLPPDMRAAATVGYPVEDTSYEVRTEWLIDFANGLFRKKSHDMSFNVANGAFRPFVRDEVFDGDGLKGHWPRRDNTSPLFSPHEDKQDVTYWKREGDLSVIVFPVDFPVFFGHGLYGVRPGDILGANLASRDFVIMGQAHIDGHDCLVVSDPSDLKGSPLRQVMYYVDPARDGAILRVETRFDGTLSDAIDIQYTREEATWMPSEWVVTYWRAIGDSESIITTEYRMSVASSVLDPIVSDQDFQIELEPGMIILRRDADFSKFQVASDGVTLKPYVPSRLRSGETSGPAASVAVRRTVIGVMNALIVGGVLAFWLLSKRRQSSH